jgi:hypothetical protein
MTVETDTLETIDPLHRRLAEQYLRATPWASDDTAIEATRYQAAQELEEQDRLDDEFRAMMDRLYPEFQKHHDEYVRAVAEGRTPPAPGHRGEEPRHPSPNPPSPPPELAGPAIDAGMPPPPPADLAGAAERFLREAGSRISERHAEQALAYQRAHPCTWAEAVYRTRRG